MDTEYDTVQEEFVEDQGSQEEVLDDGQENVEQAEEKSVPVSVVQKERRKRQEAEKRVRLLEELHEKQLNESRQATATNDDDQYEPITKAEARKNKFDTLREMDEKIWAKENPEKIEDLNNRLETFLKNRKNLVSAINEAPNRYEEAWTLMNALTPKQKATLTKQVKQQDAPGTPTSVPKAAAINQAVDVMGMSDAEFNVWRSQKRRRA